jgi:hypothetical protein
MGSPVQAFGVAALLFGACLMGGLGSLYLFHPGALRASAAISAQTPSALAELRSTYGGLHVGVAVFLLACAMRSGARRTGLLFCGLAFAGAGLARFGGIWEFHVMEPKQVVTASLELAFSVITLFLHRRWPAA